MPKPTVKLRFCAACGSLLHPSVGTEELPECENCGEFVDTTLRRLVGTFDVGDARSLEIAWFGNVVSAFPEETANDS